MHNCFEKGLAEYGHAVDQLAVDLHSLFKVSAARREDYKSVQLDLDIELHQFEQHTNVRWLSLGRCVKRIIEQWTGIIQFVAELQKNPKLVPKSVSFNRIVSATKQENILVQLRFTSFVCSLLDDFLTHFQSEQPLVHLLYDRMVEMLTSMMLKFMKADVVREAMTDARKLLSVDVGVVNHLPPDNFYIGEGARTALHHLKPEAKHRVMMGIRQSFTAMTKYLQTRLPLDNALLKNLGVLNPDTTIDDTTSSQAIRHIARKCHLTVEEIDCVQSEWQMYYIEEKPVKQDRVDHYWRQLFNIKTLGTLKYPTLTKLLKMALILPHSNADVERSLSVNNRTVTKDKVHLSEEAIIGLRATKDYVKFSDPVAQRPEQMIITRNILQSAWHSHSSSFLRLEEKKKMEQLAAQKKEETATG